MVERDGTSRNWLSLAVGFSAGAAVALLLYRVAVMPFRPATFASQLILGLGLGLAYLAYALRRNFEKDRSWRLRVTGAAAGAIVAFTASWFGVPSFARTPLEQRSLPGFSIALPSGTATVEDLDEYHQGMLRLNLDGAGVVGVSWSSQRIGTDEDEALLASMLTGLFEVPADEITSTSEFSAGGLPVRSFARAVGDTGMALSLIDCASRQITVMTVAPAGIDFRGLHRRMVASVRCLPDPARENEPGRAPPVVIDVPPGWEAGDAEVGQTAWFGETGAVLFQWATVTQPSALEKGALALVRQFGGAELSEPETIDGRTFFTSTGRFEGQPVGIVITVLPCGPRSALGLYLGGVGDPLAKGVLGSARCE